MEKKSLRQLAKELGVSPSYLSQVKNGKRPPSKKLLSKSETIHDGLQLRLGGVRVSSLGSAHKTYRQL